MPELNDRRLSEPVFCLYRGLPWIILAGCLVLTYFLTTHLDRRESDIAHLEMEMRTDEFVGGLERRVKFNAEILLGVGAFIATSPSPKLEAFRTYVSSLKLADHYLGIQAIGYVPVVRAREKKRFVADLRHQGMADYEIKPAGERAVYTPVALVEPLDWRNRRALGFDMTTEAVRFSAAQLARDTGNAVMSERITLRQETDQNIQPGVVTFVPVYHRGLPLETLEQRRQALRGWVYSALRIGDLMESYLQTEYASLSKILHIRVYAAPSLEAETLMYDSHPEATSEGGVDIVRALPVLEQLWVIRLTSMPPAQRELAVLKSSRIVAVGGCLLSIVLALGCGLLIRSNRRVNAALDMVGHMAYYDSLTHLPNRRLLKERLLSALHQAHRFQRSMALLFLDLDHFKEVNDSLGHEAGDALLVEVAKRLSQSVRKIDTVARMGGDEFVIVLSEMTHPEDAAQVAEKIIEIMRSPLSIQGHTITTATSIGIAVNRPDSKEDADDLLRRADQAMYLAKQAGRSCYRTSL